MLLILDFASLPLQDDNPLTAPYSKRDAVDLLKSSIMSTTQPVSLSPSVFFAVAHRSAVCMTNSSGCSVVVDYSSWRDSEVTSCGDQETWGLSLLV